MTDVRVMNANAIDLALQYYSDATGFIQILEANHLDDWAINHPIIAQTTTSNLVGDTTLLIQPTPDLLVGMVIYCTGYNTYGVITQVENLYTTPGRIPFAQGYADISALFPVPYAGVLPAQPIPTRILPPMGRWTSTKVSIDPGLDNIMTAGNLITFAVATPSTISIPVLPPGNRGTP